MAAVLAPWPFLDGGAMAVVVATVFDGATVEQELLWRGGERVTARLADGDVTVRLGSGGFELVLPRSCDGEVVVGAHEVALRELSLCGVTVLPLGPRTRVTVRVGTLTFVVVGTTPPQRLPLAPVRSWRQRAGIAVAAAAAAIVVIAVQARTPRVPSWALPETVRVKVAMMLPSLHGGRASAERDARVERTAAASTRPVAPNAAGARTKPKLKTAQATAQAAAAAKAQAQSQSAKMPNQDRLAAAATATAESTAQATATAESAAADSAAAAAAQKAAAAARAAMTAEDARRAAAVQAHAAGIVGALAQSHAAFLGDQYVTVSDVLDRGAISIGAGDPASSAGAASGSSGATGASGSSGASGSDGATGATATGTSTGTGTGTGAGTGDPLGTLEGDQIGEAYGTGGLGLSGTGYGGGGAGDGTIGLGNLGTIGYGSGTGTGYGYGCAAGGLGGRRASVPICTLGLAETRGSCDKDLIRRVVRAHINELRFCYERSLQSRPELAGRVVSRFVIGFDGRVSSSTIASSTLPSAAVDSCVAGAIARWQFVPRCVGEVSYPFIFESATRTAP